MKGCSEMKKIIAVILMLLFAFALIRITTSTYENKKRRDNLQSFSVPENAINLLRRNLYEK